MLVHGALVADALTPLFDAPVLTKRYRLVSYHRRGYAGSIHSDRPLSMAEQAADCRGLMGELGIDRAHIVGHSFGGAIGLQLALDAPTAVHSLTLLEASLVDVPSIQDFVAAMGPVVALYQTGDKAGAVDAFLRTVVAPDYRSALDGVVPGGYEQAVRDADTWFAQELPVLQGWRFTREEAARITQPVLAVLGAESAGLWPGWREGYDVLRGWLPRAEGFVLPGATHGLQMQNPRGAAEALAEFLAAHPFPAAAPALAH